jgi:hypothetical protein
VRATLVYKNTVAGNCALSCLDSLHACAPASFRFDSLRGTNCGFAPPSLCALFLNRIPAESIVGELQGDSDDGMGDLLLLHRDRHRDSLPGDQIAVAITVDKSPLHSSWPAWKVLTSLVWQ